MASESLQSLPEPASSSLEAQPSRMKYRIRFRKAGDLRLVSHHDLMHIFERTFRRANLTLPVTQGFNPRPRMWFALSLALGIAGLNEVLELELTERMAEEELQRRLSAHIPSAIEIVSVRAIDLRRSARVRRAWYRTSTSVVQGPALNLAERCGAFLQKDVCWIERTRPNPRRVNVRAFVSEMHASGQSLEIALWVTPTGAARPEEVFAALGIPARVEDGALIERTDLELVDEIASGNPIDVPALQNAIEEMRGNDSKEPAPMAGRPTAIISNPLSFDT